MTGNSVDQPAELRGQPDGAKREPVDWGMLVALVPTVLYLISMPPLVFTAVYFNIFGLPVLPDLKDSLLFFFRFVTATVGTNAYSIVQTLIAAVVVKYLVGIIELLFLKIQHSLEPCFTSESPLPKALHRVQELTGAAPIRWWRWLAIAVVAVLTILIGGTFGDEAWATRITGLVQFFILIVLQFGFAMLLVLLATQSLSMVRGVQVRDDMVRDTASIGGAVAVTFVLLVLVTQVFVVDRLNYSQTHGRSLRLWTDEKREFYLNCEPDSGMGRVLVSTSPLAKLEDGKEEYDRVEISSIPRSHAVSLCGRMFGK